ncbi:MAG: hypothetical protein WDM89_05590 [Rhizomicrobium sp.]
MSTHCANTRLPSTTSRDGFWNSNRGKGIPHEGNYSTFLGVQEKRLHQEGSEAAARERELAREREMDFAVTEGASGEVEGAHQRL